MTNVFLPFSSKATTVRSGVETAVTPAPKVAWWTRWPSPNRATGSGTTSATGSRAGLAFAALGAYRVGRRSVTSGAAGGFGGCDRRFGAGAWSSLDVACAETIHVTGHTSPDPVQVEVYQRQYALYRGLYPALAPTFHAG